MFENTLSSLAILLLVCLILVLTGLRKLPGLGVVPTLIIIAVVHWQRSEGLAALGLGPPNSWPETIGFSSLFGTMLALASAVIIEPLAERLTGATHDLSALGAVHSNLRQALTWVAAAWLTAATLEEIIFRGFLMREIARVLGTGFGTNLFSILTTSLVFGLAHMYQSRAGALSTGVVSLFLGAIFIWNDFNLWLLILTHGVIDSIGLMFIYLGWDRQLRNLLFRPTDHAPV